MSELGKVLKAVNDSLPGIVSLSLERRELLEWMRTRSIMQVSMVHGWMMAYFVDHPEAKFWDGLKYAHEALKDVLPDDATARDC